ncbi:MAG: hypothetical protein IT372_34980 [Polyangiaceae bacterium]|nr:hypothetical protein [Polyangiaceae bacterium]
MPGEIAGWIGQFIASLPERPGPAREEAILGAVREGRYVPVSWVEVRSEAAGHEAALFVSADALRVGDAEGSIRINASARTMQRIVDLLECVMPTTRICDLVWEQATVRLRPSIQTPDALMATVGRMVRHHHAIEQKLAGRTGLIENVGKHWVISNRLRWTRRLAANYGWFDAAALYASGKHRVWQPLGLAHDLEHVDYSQVVRLVQRRCLVDGVERDLADVMRDPALAPLVSSEGPLQVARLPGVPEGA